MGQVPATREVLVNGAISAAVIEAIVFYNLSLNCEVPEFECSQLQLFWGHRGRFDSAVLDPPAQKDV